MGKKYDLATVTDQKLGALGDKDFNALAFKINTVQLKMNIVVGRCLAEGRRRHKANQEFGAWRKEYMPDVDNSNVSKLIKCADRFNGTRIADFPITIQFELAYAPDEVVSRVGASTNTPTKEQVRQAKRDFKKGRGLTDEQHAKVLSWNKPEDLFIPPTFDMPNTMRKADAADVLGIPGCIHPTKESLDILYRGLANVRHSDKGGSVEEMALLNIARKVLS